MQNKKFKVALTGGYASGKSTVLKLFSENGFECYSADEIYNGLIKNPSFVADIYKNTGIQPKICNGIAVFDRDYISEQCFSDKDKLKKLNGFTHEKVYEKIEGYFAASLNKYVIFEIPLLFESGRQKDFDIVILVMRDVDKRAKSGAARDNLSHENALKRIKNQVDHNCFVKDAHIIINNDKDLAFLKKQVNEIIEKFKN